MILRAKHNTIEFNDRKILFVKEHLADILAMPTMPYYRMMPDAAIPIAKEAKLAIGYSKSTNLITIWEWLRETANELNRQA
jgi:hypothetical protein